MRLVLIFIFLFEFRNHLTLNINVLSFVIAKALIKKLKDNDLLDELLSVAKIIVKNYKYLKQENFKSGKDEFVLNSISMSYKNEIFSDIQITPNERDDLNFDFFSEFYSIDEFQRFNEVNKSLIQDDDINLINEFRAGSQAVNKHHNNRTGFSQIMRPPFVLGAEPLLLQFDAQLRERHEDKVTLLRPRMRKYQIGIVHLNASEIYKIDIDRTRTVADETHTSHILFRHVQMQHTGTVVRRGFFLHRDGIRIFNQALRNGQQQVFHATYRPFRCETIRCPPASADREPCRSAERRCRSTSSPSQRPL